MRLEVSDYCIGVLLAVLALRYGCSIIPILYIFSLLVCVWLTAYKAQRVIVRGMVLTTSVLLLLEIMTGEVTVLIGILVVYVVLSAISIYVGFKYNFSVMDNFGWMISAVSWVFFIVMENTYPSPGIRSIGVFGIPIGYIVIRVIFLVLLRYGVFYENRRKNDK